MRNTGEKIKGEKQLHMIAALNGKGSSPCQEQGETKPNVGGIE
jgi:hypothetical protein